MVDMKPTIQAKSDQLNADDLIAGSITIKINQVNTGSGKDQPISIRYDGDNGRPWKPCLSMRRVLVHVWGDNGDNYVGKTLTLYRDPDVKWAGAAVGGIRISHMSGIDKPVSMPLTVTRGSKKAYQVHPIENQPQQTQTQQETPPADLVAITDADFKTWTDKMDDAIFVDELKEIAGDIAKMSGKYDQASKDKLSAYYKNRLKDIKGE